MTAQLFDKSHLVVRDHVAPVKQVYYMTDIGNVEVSRPLDAVVHEY